MSCAKAFLRENVAGNRTGEIAVTFSDLSFQTYNVSAETEKYAHGDLHFAEDLVVPNQRIQSSAADVASFVDVYDFVESRLSGEQEQHHDAGNLQQIIAAEIDNYYVDSINARKGMTKYWAQTPKKMFLGCFSTRAKSWRLVVIPMPNMMIPSITLRMETPNL